MPLRLSVVFVQVFAFVVVVEACAAPVASPAAPVATATAESKDGESNDDGQCVDDRCALGVAAPGVAAAADGKAVTGAPLAVCGLSPLTGFVRDGLCRTGIDDVGAHTVCGAVSAEFLAFSKSRGNDLVTPRGDFAGLVPGDHWCLCESRVQEALEAGVRVPVVLAATNAAALRTLSKQTLEELGALAGNGAR